MTVRDLVIMGTSAQHPTRFRNPGAYLLRWNEEGHLFDPGEGTQRQFIFAGIAPPVISRIYISHFHGDHCLGLPSILLRLNLDKISHPVHCYYPASEEEYFQRLRRGTIYHETIRVIEHPISREGVVHDDGRFQIEAYFLSHGVETLGFRVREPDVRKFDKKKLEAAGIRGPRMREFIEKGVLVQNGTEITLDQVSWIRPGDTFAYIADTRECKKTLEVARDAKLLLCESTYLHSDHKHLAKKHGHLTAQQAALIAKHARAKKLVLTHFSARYPDSRAHVEEARKFFPNTISAHDLQVIPFER